MSWFETGEFYAFSCASLWAVAVILFRIAGHRASPITLNLFKNTVGLTLLSLTVLLKGIPFWSPEINPRDLWVLLASGALGIAVADSLVFASLHRLGAGGQAIVDCLYSPLVILSAFFYLGEPLRPVLLLSMALIILAIVIGTWPSAGDNNGKGKNTVQRKQQMQGVGLGSLAMVFMATGIVMAKPALEHTDTLWATTVRLAGAMPLLMFMGLTRSRRSDTLRAFRPGPHWKVLMPAAVLGAYVSLILWIMGFKYTSAGVAGLLNQTSTISILVLATLFLKEPLTWRRAVAVLLGFAGGALVMI